MEVLNIIGDRTSWPPVFGAFRKSAELFCNLPLELQQTIWDMVDEPTSRRGRATRPRILEICFESFDRKNKHAVFCSRGRAPVIMHVCRVFRAIGLARYEPLILSEAGHPTYVRWEYDCFYFASLEYLAIFVSQCDIQPRLSGLMRQCTRFLIPINDVGFFSENYRSFARFRSLSVVKKDKRPSHSQYTYGYLRPIAFGCVGQQKSVYVELEPRTFRIAYIFNQEKRCLKTWVARLLATWWLKEGIRLARKAKERHDADRRREQFGENIPPGD